MRLHVLCFISLVSGGGKKSPLGPKLESPHIPIKRTPPSFGGPILVKQGYTSAMNLRTHMPDWVAERLTVSSFDLRSEASRKNSFWTVDEMLMTQAPEYEIVIFNSKKVFWSHGHLAPASHHKDSQTALDETFQQPSNAVPQEFSVNGCDWNRLENFTAGLFRYDAHPQVFVLSGPLWLPEEKEGRKEITMEFIGGVIPVPTHLFKVILYKSKKGSGSIAFVMPNAEILELLPITDYRRSLDEVEGFSGLDLKAYKTKTDLCTIANCNEEYMTDYMHCLKTLVKIKHARNSKKLAGLIKDAAYHGCFNFNVNNNKPELTETIREKTEQILKKSFNDPQDLVDALFVSAMTKTDYLHFQTRTSLFYALQTVW